MAAAGSPPGCASKRHHIGCGAAKGTNMGLRVILVRVRVRVRVRNRVGMCIYEYSKRGLALGHCPRLAFFVR